MDIQLNNLRQKTQQFIDDPESMDKLLVRQLVKRARSINNEEFNYSEEIMEGLNFWRFLLRSNVHLEKFINTADTEIYKKEWHRFAQEISFVSHQMVDIFEILGDCKSLDLSFEQNAFLFELSPRFAVRGDFKHKITMSNQEMIEYWGALLAPQDKERLDSLSAEPQQFLDKFLELYDENGLSKNNIYLYSLLSEKIVGFSKQQKIDFMKDAQSKNHAVEFDEHRDFLNCITQYHLTLSKQDSHLLSMGAIYLHNQKAIEYVKKNKITIERDKINTLLENIPTQSVKKVNKL